MKATAVAFVIKKSATVKLIKAVIW